MHGAINYFSPVFLFLPVIFALLLIGTATRPNGMEIGNHKWLQEVHRDVFIKEGLNLHSPGVMGSFPSCANATGEWGLCCQASLQRGHQSTGLDTDYLSKKVSVYIFFSRDRKETFLIPDTSQALHSVGEIAPVVGSIWEHTLMIKWHSFKNLSCLIPIACYQIKARPSNRWWIMTYTEDTGGFRMKSLCPHTDTLEPQLI